MGMKIMCTQCHEHNEKSSFKDGQCPGCGFQMLAKTDQRPSEPNYFKTSALDIQTDGEEIIDLVEEVNDSNVSHIGCLRCDGERLKHTSCPHCGNVFINI